MTQSESLAIEMWIQMVARKAALTGKMPEPAFVDEILAMLDSGSPADHLQGTDMTPAHWDETHLRLFPTYQRVGGVVAEALALAREIAP